MVVPLYNEAHRLAATTRELIEALSGEGLVEILLADDGSQDGTGAAAARLAAADPRLVPLAWPRNRGKGYAIRQALPRTRGDLVLCTDADLSAALSGYRRLRAALDHGADLAIGSRAVPGAEFGIEPPRYRELLGRTGNLILRLVDPALRPFADTQCGFKLGRGEVLRAVAPWLTIDRWGGDFELLHVAVGHGYRVAEIPVRWSDARPTRVGRLDHVATLGELARLLWNESRGGYRR